jgi:polygalacturonase
MIKENIKMINYHFPKSFPRAEEIKVYVNKEEVDVLKTNVGYIVSVAYEGTVQIDIESVKKINKLTISPLRLNLKATINQEKAAIVVDENVYLYIEVDGVSRPIFFYGNKITNYNSDEATYYFKAGQIYEVGDLMLKDNESIYIEGGAIVVGGIRATNSSNIKIYGNGILDGSYFMNSGHRTILMDKCTMVEIKDITIIQPPCWMILIAGCTGVHIDHVKEIGEVIGSDGVDIVGSSDVLVENCIFRNNDDSIAIKAFERMCLDSGKYSGWNQKLDNIEIRHCTFINGGGGNAIEIGHELQIDEVKNIHFHDIDIVCVSGFGAAIAIHAGDRATVKDVIYENIRIQHYYDKLIDFRVMKSKFNSDEKRGQIRNILLRNIKVRESEYNPGYSISLIGGYDEEHTVEDVIFEEFYLNDRKIMNADQLDLHSKNVKNIIFR